MKTRDEKWEEAMELLDKARMDLTEVDDILIEMERTKHSKSTYVWSVDSNLKKLIH